MKFNYSKKDDALSVRFSDEAYAESDQVSEGFIFDYDEDGHVIGFEVLDASRRLSPQFSKQIKNGNIPAGLGQ